MSPSGPVLRFHDDAAAFLAEAGEHLAADPVQSTVLASNAERAAAEAAAGRVAFVGSGPGDPGLLTVRARDALAAATLVVADRGVPADVLGLLPSTTTVRSTAARLTTRRTLPRWRTRVREPGSASQCTRSRRGSASSGSVRTTT